MANLLKFLGIASIIAGLVVGYIQADKAVEFIGLGRSIDMPFQWTVALTWWLSGFISGIVFFAIGMVLDKLDRLQVQIGGLYENESNTPSRNYAAKSPNTKLNLDSAKGFKMKSID